ncbi:MAG TPA: TIR domain-containing protein [Sphingomicrobium sp.]|nr:TIR domain-containing protein [Sphingomicrobium sp.]
MHGVTQNAQADRARGASADEPATRRYWAYLSYSHRDDADAKWLHDAIEQYRVPTSLVGRPGVHGPAPRSFAPIFRDRQDLAASNDLAERIEGAIAQSRFLIVLCSPAAAQSHWTNQEIITFKRLHPRGSILAAIVGGEPFASAIAGRESEECFPPALRVQFDKRGRATAKRAEPIAADLREGRDGRRMGLLKIVAGMLGVGLDDLVQREAQRRQKRLRMVIAASLLGMTVTSGLAVTSVLARNEAREQRREAEGLVGFMLGDLRGKLEPVGRLDVLDAVGARALAYFEKQDKGELSDEGLAQRARALTLIGEIANTRGDLNGAMRRYREALASTGEALRRFPDDPQRLYDHAQNIFWVGYIAWQRGQTANAESAFHEYKRLAERMIAIDPANPRWRLEGKYADTNLGMLTLEQRRYSEAAAIFQRSLAQVEGLAAASPRDMDYQKALLETLAYHGEALEKAGRLEESLAQRERLAGLIERLRDRDRGDLELVRKAMAVHRALGRMLAMRGEVGAGLDHARTSAALADGLLQTEPANTEWLEFGASAHLDFAELLLATGQTEQAAVEARSGCASVSRLIERDRSVVSWNDGLRGTCLMRRARLALAQGRAAEALILSEQSLAVARSAKGTGTVDSGIAVAQSAKLAGDALQAMGQGVDARGRWSEAAAAWPRNIAHTPTHLAQQAIILRDAGDARGAAEIAARLDKIGYRHPDYLKAMQTGGRK